MNVLKAIFTDGVDEITVHGLTQWDKGQTLQITLSSLPASFQVHFANKRDDTAYVVEATASGGVATVLIPNLILHHRSDAVAWIYLNDGDSGETIKTINLPIQERAKPEGYAYTEVEILDYKTLDRRIDALELGGSGGGLSTTAANLLIEILRHVHEYEGDQSANIDALAAELGVTEEEEPDTPVEPDEPVTPEVTLSSISATYSGGDVAVGTAVTDLTGIVVTATYSDGSTATVTDYTLSGEIVEGSNTITVSYGGKTTTFTVTGVAESVAGDIAVALTDGGTLPFNFSAFSDDGSAGTVTKVYAYNPYQYTSGYFTEDTEVTITFNATGTILGRKAAAVCIPAEATIFNKGYYYKELGSFNDIVNAGGVKYTVKEGCKLYLVQTGGTPSQGTFGVTRVGAEGDGVMATYVMSGEEVAMTTATNVNTQEHTWYADAGETVATNYPTNAGTFVATSTETFTEDTEVAVEMYHATSSDKVFAVSYNAEGRHFTELINDTVVKMSNRPIFVYTVRAGHQLMVVSGLNYPYEIKVVK